MPKTSTPTTTATPQIPVLATALADYALPLIFSREEFARALKAAEGILAESDTDDRYDAIAGYINDHIQRIAPGTKKALDDVESGPLSIGTVHNAYADPALMLGFALAYRLLSGAR